MYTATAMAFVATLVASCDGAWQLVWSDEFDGTSLDTQKWNYEVDCLGGYNNEQQCYTSSSANSWVSGGLLTIKAMPTAGQSLPYSSARLNTKNKGDWKYGKFVARMKLPSGQGSWPAFWMLPTESKYGSVPLSGEIDIMEAVNLKVNSKSEAYGTVHYGRAYPNNGMTSSTFLPPNGVNPADGYHVYGAEWEEGEIRLYVDDTHHATIRRSTANYDSAGNPVSLKHRGWYHEVDGKLVYGDSPFNEKFHMLLNFAVGGSWPTSVDDKGIDATAFVNGQFMYVDYVRVYECSVDKATGRGCATVASDYVEKTLKTGQAPDLTANSVVIPPSSTPAPPPPAPSVTCAQQWDNNACFAGSCYTCGARIEYLISTGMSDAASRNQVAAEIPADCGACATTASPVTPPPTPAPPTCASQWDANACYAGNCYTCGARIEYLIGTGTSDSAARNQVAAEIPAVCGACAAAATPPPTPSPPTCASQWDNNACYVGNCYTCGARIEYLIGTGFTSAAARNEVAAQIPSACGACAG
eukprot:gene6074-9330_t